MVRTLRGGRVEFSERLIHENPQEVAAIFTLLELIPVRAEAILLKGVVQYDALSPKFREMPIGACIPEYDIEVTRERGWPVSVEVKEKQ